jgi:DNA topoisomerase-1
MELGLDCPKPDCEGELVSRRGKGRRFLGCSKYPECDFTAFGTPDKETACPECGNEWTVTVKNKGRTLRQCPKPECNYEQDLGEE